MNYKFEQNAKFYHTMYLKARAEDSLDKAAEYLLEAIRLESSSSYRIELASLYSEMNQLDMSNQECFKILASNPKNIECLSLLSSNFAKKQNFRAAYFYFSQFDDYGIDELTDMVVQEADIDEFSKMGFKMVYSNGIKDCSDLKEEAEIYISMKSYKDAIRTLNSIPKNSPQYAWAQKVLVLCYYMVEDYQSSLDITNTLLLNNSEDISVIAVAYNILIESGQKSKANEYIDRIISLKCNEISDVLKAGYCLIDAKRFAEAIELMSNELDKYKYNDNLLLLLSNAYYLNNNIDKAKGILLKLINMYGDRTHAKIYLESYNLNEATDGGIAYGIPAGRALKYNMMIDQYSRENLFRKEFLYNSKFKNVLKWRLLADSSDDFSYSIVSMVGYLRNSAAAQFLKELLLSEKISGELKVNALYELFYCSNKSRVAIVYDAYFRIINMINPNTTTPAFVEAYALCAIFLSPMLKDYEDEIYRTFMMLNNKLKDNLSRMQSPEALAALIIYYTDNLEMSKEHKIITGIFGATLQTFRKYLKIMENRE